MTYQRFAHVYDQLMTDIPYSDYVKWVEGKAPSSRHKRLLDIGCGTGTLTQMFYHSGYDVTGLDLSEEMLSIAQDRFEREGAQIQLVCQSMDELEGFDGFDVAVVAIDSLNYLESAGEVEETFGRIHESLNSEGHLFFDVHSVYKMDKIFMEGPFTFDNEEIAYIWHTEGGEDPHSVHHDLTFFMRLPDGRYDRFDETHYQRTFPVENYVLWLKEAGFSSVEVTADWSGNLPDSQSERIFFHAIK